MPKVQRPEMTLYEKVDVEILGKLITAEDTPEHIRVQLRKYYSKLNQNGVIPVAYFFGQSIENNEVGRLYGQGGLTLQSLKKEVRHALAKGTYWDIDMANAQPNLLMQYCLLNKIKCPILISYIRKREDHLKHLMSFHNIDRGEAKNLFLRFMYLGQYMLNDKVPPKKSLIAELFQQEMVEISEAIWEKETRAVETVKKDPSKRNPKSSVMSVILNDLENKCLMAMKDYFDMVKLQVGTLCFDGLLLQKCNNGKVSTEEVIKKKLIECQRFVKTKTDFSIKLEIKPMDLKLGIKLPNFDAYVYSDTHAAQKLISIEGANKFKYCGGELYIFDERTGMFTPQGKHCVTLNYYLEKNARFLNKVVSTNPKTGEEKIENYGRDTNARNRIVTWVQSQSLDDDWFSETDDTSRGYMLFRDGIYNFKESSFEPGFNANIVFHVRCPWNFPQRKQSSVDYAMKLTFGTLLDVPQRLVTAMAVALAGDPTKSIYYCPGRSNSGKSELINALKFVFGKIIGNFNMESMACMANHDTKEEAQILRWALALRYCRIIFSSEANMKKAIDGNQIKKLTGGDELIGRMNHGNEVAFTPHFTPFCFMNDIPSIQPMDQATYNRGQYEEFAYVFVEEKELDVTHPDYKPYNKLKDPDYKKKYKIQKFVDGMIHIMLDAYDEYMKSGMPKFDPKVKTRWTEEGKQDAVIRAALEEVFLFNEETKNDKILVADMNKFKLKRPEIFGEKGKETISAPKFNTMMKDEFGIVQSQPNGGARYWLGIKFKPIVKEEIEFLEDELNTNTSQ